MSGTPSIDQLQAEIEASRTRLAGTIDELSQRATPKAIMDRQKASAKAAFVERATSTKAQVNAFLTDERGEYRQDRIIQLAAAGVGLLVIGLAVRRRR
ncbi:DUF3618 domain-containing protein [Kribbia dieselivorans]|uniref:DUF3618 domain-containing protein n=1 Tax=Kribbia dieselivorans TaxID=331526 RepID=UPI0008388F99|nr:DUF3618 domain-containing protein [Kribbia dieselivorans]